MFKKKMVFVLIAMCALALTAAGQKPGSAKATPSPATRSADTDKSMGEEAAQFKKTLNSLVKMMDKGFKDVRGEEKPKNDGDFFRRFKTSVTLLQAEACEITLPSFAELNSNRAYYVAYYPLVPPTARRKLYEKLVEAVTEALGPDFHRFRNADDFDEDSTEEKYDFMRKGSTMTIVSVSYRVSQSRFDPIKTDVILKIGYSYL